MSNNIGNQKLIHTLAGRIIDLLASQESDMLIKAAACRVAAEIYGQEGQYLAACAVLKKALDGKN